MVRLFQSLRKPSIPLSVNGCWNKPINTLYGMVAMCAPRSAASVTWIGLRMEAAMISVSKPCTAKMSATCEMSSRPFWPISSSLPRNGDT